MGCLGILCWQLSLALEGHSSEEKVSAIALVHQSQQVPCLDWAFPQVEETRCPWWEGAVGVRRCSPVSLPGGTAQRSLARAPAPHVSQPVMRCVSPPAAPAILQLLTPLFGAALTRVLPGLSELLHQRPSSIMVTAAGSGAGHHVGTKTRPSGGFWQLLKTNHEWQYQIQLH